MSFFPLFVIHDLPFILTARGWCRFAATTNHQIHMRTIRGTTFMLSTLLITCGDHLPLHAQEAQLAQLGSPSAHDGTILTHTSISDDGDDLAALPQASQLLITFSSGGAGQVSVQVLDEAGKVVMQHTAVGRAGRQLVPLDVSGLASGRYLVRVQEGTAVSASRFLRP